MLFWQIYAYFYNKLNELLPYQEHVFRVLSLIDIQATGVFLDVGCGTGNLVKNKPNIVGIDISTGMLELARKKNPLATFVCCDLNKPLPFPNKSFDGAYSSNVFAYLDKPAEVLMEIHRVLKPGANFVLGTLRKTFNPYWILWDHVRRSSVASVLKNIFFVLAILLLNIPIVIKLKRNLYHGLEMEDLRELLGRCGFEFTTGEYSYSNQDVLILAKRL